MGDMVLACVIIPTLENWNLRAVHKKAGLERISNTPTFSKVNKHLKSYKEDAGMAP